MTRFRRETPTAPGMAPPAGGPGPSRAVAAIALAVATASALFAAPGARRALAEKVPAGIITEVRIEGLGTVKEEEARKVIKSRAGRPLDRDLVEKDLKALSKLQKFSDIKPFWVDDPSGKGHILIFAVKEMPILKHVEFRGRTKVTLKEIENNTGLKVGARADYIRARMAASQIKNLYDEKGYELAEVKLIEGGAPGDTRVIFEIFEGPKVKLGTIDFEGNTIVSDALLRTKISSRTPILMMGGTFRRDDVDADTRKLIDYYQGMGYLECKVSPVIRNGSGVGDRRLTFVISEGIQYRVRNIEFKGNEKLTTAQLKSDLKLHSGLPYGDSVREVDLKHLRDRYASIGCVDIEIRDERKYTDEPGVIDLVYNIVEGELFTIGEINVFGNQRTRDKVVRRELLMAGLVPGQPLDGTKLELAQKRLKNLGYFQSNPEMGKPIELKIVNRRPRDQPYADTSPVSMDEVMRASRFQNAEEEPAAPPPAPALPPLAEEAPGPGRDAITPFGGAAGPFDPPPDQLPALTAPPIPPGPPPGPGPAPRRGGGPPRGPINQPIDAGVPPGTFPSLPGENATDVGPDRSEAFRERNPSNVTNQVEPGPGTNDRSFADINAFVDEAPTGNLMIGVGASSFQGLSGNVIVHEKNFDLFAFPRSARELFSGQAFRGAGQDLRIQISPGTVINQAIVSFREPYLFNLPIGLGVTGYGFTRIYPDWDERRIGGRFSLGRQFGPSTYADMALRVEDINFYGFKTPAPADFLAASGHSVLSTIRPSLRFDNRNDPIAPNKGQYLEVAFEQGWGTFTFPKLEITGKTYFLTGSRPDGTGKRIVTLRGMYGVTGPNTPVYERFFAGDFGSMRGFAFRGVGPHVLGVNVGGVMRAIGSVEYQYPLLASDKLQQVFFCDFGTVDPGYDFSGFRAAVGTGLRVVIPQLGPMPLAFDIAFPVSKVEGDKTRYFTFFIGAFW